MVPAAIYLIPRLKKGYEATLYSCITAVWIYITPRYTGTLLLRLYCSSTLLSNLLLIAIKDPTCILTGASHANPVQAQKASLYNQEYIIEREGEYPTSLWACVTTLYGGHDLCNDIHIQSGFHRLSYNIT